MKIEKNVGNYDLALQSHNISLIELVWDVLDRRILREYPNRECELLQYLKNPREGLTSTFFKYFWKNVMNL